MTWNATENKTGLTIAAGLLLTLAALPAQAMTLSKALELASQHDPTISLAQATYEAERELGKQVSGTLLPTVNLEGSAAYNDTESQSEFFGTFSESYDGYAAGVSVRQPVLRFDWFARGRQADALDAKAQAALKDREMQFYLRVVNRYFAVLMAQDELRLAEAEAKAIAESLADTQKRHEVGLVPGTDLKEAKARNDLAQAQLILSRQQLSSAQDALDESTGNGYVALPELPENAELPPLEPADIEAWVAKVRKQNPGLMLAQEAVTVAESEADTAGSELLPSVDAVASYRHNDTSESRIGSESDEGRLALELTVPIYQGGVKRARSREAAARLRAAQADRDRILVETERLTRQQYRELQAAYAQERALNLAVASAVAAEEATRNGYQAGTRTITDVLNARSAVISAQRDYSRTRYNLLVSLLELKQLAAELSEKDFQSIDQLLQKPVRTEDSRT